MEKPEFGIGWYVTHQGQAYGPVSFEDLKFEAGRGKLKPRFDCIWREGFKSWVLAGEIDGLFEGKEDEIHEDIVIDELVDEYFERKEWGGMGRGKFLIFAFLFPVLMAGAWFHLREVLDENLLHMYLLGSGVMIAGILLVSMILRLRNLAMSFWWILGMIVPILNLWLLYRLFACPHGYAEHKDMDDAGWLLSWVFWFPVAALAGLGVFALVKGPETLSRLLDRNLIQQLPF